MRSYPLYIDGKDVEGTGWTYVVETAAFLDDEKAAFNLKRALELGEERDAGELKRVVGRCALSTDEQNLAALDAAAAAKVAWGRFPVDTRFEIAARFHEEVTRRHDELVEILVAEGHPVRLARWEVSGLIQATSEATQDVVRRLVRQEYTDGDRRLILVRKPDGVVCVNPPANAAGSNAALGVSALIGGNTLVVKAPRTSPLSVMYIYRDIVAPILDELGAPPGTLNLVSGMSRRILQQWLNSPLVDDIMFFGDSDTGLRLGQDCLARGKKAVLELAGNDGCVVWRDADLDLAVEAIAECFYGSGQICMVPKYVVAHPAIAGELVDRLARHVATIRPGYPGDPAVVLSPVMKGDRFYDFLAEATSAGATLVAGGRRIDLAGVPSNAGQFFEPTVLRVDGLARARQLRCVSEETFFPMLPVVVAEEAPDDVLLERFVAFLDGNAYGLRNSVWASDPAVIEAFVEGVTSGGILKVNDSHIGFVPVLATHGGTGRTGGPYGELHYPILRTTHLQGISVATGVSPRDAVFGG